MRHLFFVAVALLPITSSVAQAQPRLVARTGTSAQGIAGFYSGFDAPVIIGGGYVAFGATVNDGNFNFTKGLWSEGDGIGALRAVALKGDVAPTAGSLTFTGFYDPERSYLFNDLGDVTFLGELTGFVRAIYTDRERFVGPALLEIAREGQPAADTGAGRTYNGFDILSMAHIHSGVAFKSLLAPGVTPDNFPSAAIYNEGFSVILGNVAEVADTAPGTSRPSPLGPALFTEFHAPTINDSGHVAFSATTNAGSSVGSVGGEGIWTTSPAGTLRPVALAGETAPGAPSTFSIIFGRSLLYDSTPVINDDGDVAFQATLTGLIAGDLRVGTWVERNGVVQKVAYESESAPDTSSTFQRLNEPLIDSSGLTAFTAELADGNDGLWRESAPGVLTKLAMQGEPAPGTAFNYQNINDLALNRTGTVAFVAQLSSFSKNALYTTDSNGVVQKIVASDDVIDLEGSPFRVDQVFFQGLTGAIEGTGNGLGSGLNDDGQLGAIVRGEILDEVLMPTGEFLDALVVFEPPVACAMGDFDCDNDIDGRDFLVWQRGGSPNGINSGDLAFWQGQYGTPLTANATAVPEPSSWALLIAVAASATISRIGNASKRPYLPI